MKKLFLAICFIIAGSSQLQARVQEVLDMSSVPQPQQQTQTTNPKVTEVSADGLGKFLEETKFPRHRCKSSGKA